MRPLLAIVLAVSIILGVQTFISASARTSVGAADVVEVEAEGKFEVEILLTFDAAPDAFSLDGNDSPAVSLEQRGKSLLQSTEEVQAGQLLLAEAPGIVEGKNEFYLSSHPADDEPDLVRVARVRILRDGQSLGEHWITSEPGLAAEGPVMIDVTASIDSDAEHDH